MTDETRKFLAETLEILVCPKCSGELALDDDRLLCPSCAQAFSCANEIPQLFWPTEWTSDREDVTEAMKAFYEDTPFPNYDEFDSVASLLSKARQGIFAKLLDDQVPAGARILECGCGTGQLSNLLSVANRTVFGSDMCLNSLGLAQDFKERNGLSRAHFFQMNLFRPIFKPESFDLVISNGVLHHTGDPFLCFETISKLVKPGGFILVGLYHKYGRLITDLRRQVFRFSRDRFTGLDPNLRADGSAAGTAAKWKAWFRDQYKNPHESKHTIGEVMDWLDQTGCRFVKSIPRGKPFQPFGDSDRLFEAEEPGNALERLMVEIGMIRTGSREGGFFTVIGRKD